MIPNTKTQEVMDSTDRGENLIQFSSSQEMFEYLDIGCEEITKEQSEEYEGF